MESQADENSDGEEGVVQRSVPCCGVDKEEENDGPEASAGVLRGDLS